MCITDEGLLCVFGGFSEGKKGNGKGGAAKRTPSEPRKDGFKRFNEMSEKEKDDVRAKQKQRPCAIMVCLGSCRHGQSCAYSHDKGLCDRVKKEECPYGSRCLKLGRMLNSATHKGFPSCCYRHEGKLCTDGWVRPTAMPTKGTSDHMEAGADTLQSCLDEDDSAETGEADCAVACVGACVDTIVCCNPGIASQPQFG